jgi:hypothetical protein
MNMEKEKMTFLPIDLRGYIALEKMVCLNHT